MSKSLETNAVGKKSKQINHLVYETIDELVARTKLPKSWIYSRTRETGPDAIPRLKMGKYLRFVPCEVDAWLRKQSEAE